VNVLCFFFAPWYNSFPSASSNGKCDPMREVIHCTARNVRGRQAEFSESLSEVSHGG